MMRRKCGIYVEKFWEGKLLLIFARHNVKQKKSNLNEVIYGKTAHQKISIVDAKFRFGIEEEWRQWEEWEREL